jgi:hypothetical protein
MEVHHHTHTPDPDSHRGRKKWTHYFWEFFMLFLAVTLGFFVENQREHFIEHKSEKQYIQSFYEDLTADENDLEHNIQYLRQQMQDADSLQILLKDATKKQPANQIYMYLREITRSSDALLYPNDRTIVQLRNAGGMRLIKNKSVSDSMVGYYRTIEIIQFLSENAIDNKKALREKYIPLLNAEDFSKIIDSASAILNPAETLYLRNVDPDLVNNCLVEVNRIKAINSTLAIRMRRLKEKAGHIKGFIKKEYHLK